LEEGNLFLSESRISEFIEDNAYEKIENLLIGIYQYLKNKN
jgi:hypothetical protein